MGFSRPTLETLIKVEITELTIILSCALIGIENISDNSESTLKTKSPCNGLANKAILNHGNKVSGKELHWSLI